MSELPKKYVPAEHESAIRRRWNESGAFHALPEPVLSGKKHAYAIVIPPPNVTARLHLGHALNNTLQDILVRAKRMLGFETLWMPGTDHAGIATQTVVEKRLLEEEKKRRTDFSREDFVARVQAWKDEYEAVITEQLMLMGCSCDFERQRFTMDPICARAVREAFFRLFKDGLIYRGKRLVNWDPVTQTALADDEVDMKEIDGQFYYLRYPLVHKPRNPSDPLDTEPVTWSELASRGYPVPQDHEHDDDARAWLTVATTRPETYLGDTAVAVNPSDPRAAALDGFMVQLPLVGRVIPIVKDDYVVMANPESDDPKARYATGFLKVTPAHDPNDWEIGQRHQLPAINVMAPDASISDKFGWEDVRDARVFLGMSREVARKKVVKEFEARKLLEATKPYRHSVGHSYRSHAAIEPYLSDQWYVRVTDDRLRGAALRAMAADQRTSREHTPHRGVKGDGELRFFPARYSKTFEQWHENLRDWCISRQLWWGHRIPIWSCSTAAQLDPNENYGKAVGGFWKKLKELRAAGRVALDPSIEIDDTLGPLKPAGGRKEKVERIEVCIRDEHDQESIGLLSDSPFTFEQDPDVLDTWFSSALWPMSTMGWPEPPAEMKGLLEAFNPTDVLCTAREIITLWVSRMVMFNRFFLSPDGGHTPGQLPFDDVFIHAMIQDGEGRKMSKSLGNGVDPVDIITTHGSDAMRFVLCHMTTQTQDVRMPVERDPATGKNTSPKFDIGRNFCTKLWNASRFAMMNLAESIGAQKDAVDFTDLALCDRWMLSRLRSAILKIEEALSDYQFSSYAQIMYDLLWRDFCDWYLEAIKPTVKQHPGQQAVLRASLDCILRLLHPICPFVTEAIFEEVAKHRRATVKGLHLDSSPLLATAAWPKADSGLANEEAELAFARLQSLVDVIRQTRSQANIEPRQKLTLHISSDLAHAIKHGGGVVETLAGVETIATAPPGPDSGRSLTFTFEAAEFHISGLGTEVDAGAELEMLQESLTKLDKDIAVLESRLSNPGYASKAPPHIVQQTRDQLSQREAERETVRRRIRELT